MTRSPIELLWTANKKKEDCISDGKVMVWQLTENLDIRGPVLVPLLHCHVLHRLALHCLRSISKCHILNIANAIDIHPKSENIGGDYFSAQKCLQKKCIKLDDKSASIIKL